MNKNESKIKLKKELNNQNLTCLCVAHTSLYSLF